MTAITIKNRNYIEELREGLNKARRGLAMIDMIRGSTTALVRAIHARAKGRVLNDMPTKANQSEVYKGEKGTMTKNERRRRDGQYRKVE
jgi:hypothetical protein